MLEGRCASGPNSPLLGRLERQLGHPDGQRLQIDSCSETFFMKDQLASRIWNKAQLSTDLPNAWKTRLKTVT